VAPEAAKGERTVSELAAEHGAHPMVSDRAAIGSGPVPNGHDREEPPKLSAGAQCRLRSIARSSFCYAQQGETAMTPVFVFLIDKQFPETPFCPSGR
jgi:hypothetical protein